MVGNSIKSMNLISCLTCHCFVNETNQFCGQQLRLASSDQLIVFFGGEGGGSLLPSRATSW